MQSQLCARICHKVVLWCAWKYNEAEYQRENRISCENGDERCDYVLEDISSLQVTVVDCLEQEGSLYRWAERKIKNKATCKWCTYLQGGLQAIKLGIPAAQRRRSLETFVATTIFIILQQPEAEGTSSRSYLPTECCVAFCRCSQRRKKLDGFQLLKGFPGNSKEVQKSNLINMDGKDLWGKWSHLFPLILSKQRSQGEEVQDLLRCTCMYLLIFV